MLILSYKHSQQGQVLLIVILTMVVALTVGLGLAARSATNVRTTVDQVNSDRAFSAAEAGIQRILKTQEAEITNQQLDNQTYIKQVTTDTDFGRSAFLINNGNPLPQDDGAEIWLSTYPDFSAPQLTGSLDIYWGQNSSCSDAALEILVLSGTRLNPTVEKYALDPCTTRGNNFSAPTGAGGTVVGKTFLYSTSVAVTNGLWARITPYYTGTPIAVVAKDASGNTILLPSQGKLITSVGTSADATRKISYFQGYDELPSEFLYSVFQPQ